MWHTHTWEVVRPHRAVQEDDFLGGEEEDTCLGLKGDGPFFHVTMDTVDGSVCLNEAYSLTCEPLGLLMCHKTLMSTFVTLVLISLFIKSVTTEKRVQEFE